MLAYSLAYKGAVMADQDWLHLKAYGYAPGNYMGRCRVCNTVVDGIDKRAITCRPCAEKKHADADIANRAAAAPTHHDERLQELAHSIKLMGLEIFEPCLQETRSALEWFAAELSVSKLPPDHGTLVADRVKRLQDAIEGECDGLAVDEQHARAILAYVDGA